MAEYDLQPGITDPAEGYECIEAANFLGEFDIRYCFTGQAVCSGIGCDVATTVIELAIADDQIDNARSILLDRGFKDGDPEFKFHDGRGIPLRESSERLSGYCLESAFGNQL